MLLFCVLQLDCKLLIKRLFSKMPRSKDCKTNRGNFSTDMMKKAVEDVLQKHKSVRSSAKLNGADGLTLARYLRDVKMKMTLTRR